VSDEQGCTACAASGLDVSPAIPDHERPRETQVEILGRLVKKPGSRFPACATVAVVVETRVDVNKPVIQAQALVECLHQCSGGETADDVRLIRDHDGDEQGGADEAQRLPDPREVGELGVAARRPRNPAFDGGVEDHPVTVDEDGAAVHPARNLLVSASPSGEPIS
jgi:hypothetical protein